MKNKFENNNEKIINNENKYTNKKLAIISGVIVTALVISFFGSYFITNRLTNPKYTKNTTGEEKTVYNNTKALDDDMILVLMNQGVIERRFYTQNLNIPSSLEPYITNVEPGKGIIITSASNVAFDDNFEEELSAFYQLFI